MPAYVDSRKVDAAGSPCVVARAVHAGLLFLVHELFHDIARGGEHGDKDAPAERRRGTPGDGFMDDGQVGSRM